MPNLSPDILQMRTKMLQMRGQGHTLKEIAIALDITLDQVHACVQRRSFRGDAYQPRKRGRVPVLAFVLPEDLPIETLSGTMHVVPCSPPRLNTAESRRGLRTCDICDWLPMCRRWVEAGDFIACERPLVRELIDYEPIQSTEPHIATATSPSDKTGSIETEPTSK